MKLFPAGSISALMLAATTFAHAAPVIVDGSFEDPNDDAPGIYAGGGAGWTTSFHGAVAIIRGNIQDGNGNWYGVTPYGQQYLGLDPRTRGFVSSDSQSIAGFVAGETYTLKLDVADSDGGSAPQLTVLFSDGSSTNYVDNVVDVPVGGPYGTTIGFHEVDTTFKSTVTGSMTLSLINSGNPFASPGADPGSISIDNVRLDVSAVPEPSPAMTLLLGLGFLGAAAARKRRR